MFFCPTTMSTDNLNSYNKKELMDMVKELRTENLALKELQAYIKLTNERLVVLERAQNREIQYQRRNTIEITGIPTAVKQDRLEEEVVKIFNAAGVSVNDHKLDPYQIQACHRVGKKGVTVCKFTNRKFAYEGLYCSRNLKGKNIYGDNSQIYINHSLCKEYGYLNYCIRNAKRANKIHRYKVKHGVNFIQLEEGAEFVEISHKNDLVELDLIDL